MFLLRIFFIFHFFSLFIFTSFDSFILCFLTYFADIYY